MKNSGKISRRKFLQSAAVGSSAALAASLPVKSSAKDTQTGSRQQLTPYEEVLSKCGSEFGDIRHSD